MLKETEVGSCMVWPMAWKMNGKQLNYAAGKTCARGAEEGGNIHVSGNVLRESGHHI